jgi:hypothetical protein
MLSRLALAMLFLLTAAAAASARMPGSVSEPHAYIIGDSLGMGVSYAAGVKPLARPSVHIQGPKILEQLANVPAGATVFVVVGSNDSGSDIKTIQSGIDALIRAAEARNIRLVWVGAPCVRRSWNAKSAALDLALRKRFANTTITYVSMHDATICSGQFFAPDGVHMTMKGYTYMWDKARRAAGWGAPNESTPGAGSPNKPTAVAAKPSAEPAEPAATAPAPSTAAAPSAATPPAPPAATPPAPTAVTETETPPAAAPAGVPDAGTKNPPPPKRVAHREPAPRKRDAAPPKRTPVAGIYYDERYRN